MINIAIESIKLLLNEINTNENKNVFNIIIMIRLMRRWESLLRPPDTFMVITFAGALRQALLHVFELGVGDMAKIFHVFFFFINHDDWFYYFV